MKHLAGYILIASFVLLLTVCKKSDSAQSATNIFVAGNESSMPKYWKNGEAILLTGNYTYAQVFSMFVSGHDIYFAGSAIVSGLPYGIAIYWKNGQAIPLSDGT